MKIRRLFFSAFMIVTLIITTTSDIFADGTDNDIFVSANMPQIKAKALCVMDANTGHVLFESGCHEKLYVSYLGKLMTVLLTAKAVDSGKLPLDKELVTSKHANSTKDPQLWLNVGETIKASDALKAVCMANPNDAAMVLAEAVGGNEEKFVSMMNDEAKKLDMSDSSFVNPIGIDTEGQYSSAYDMALLSKEVLKHDFLVSYMTEWMTDLRDGKTNVVNTNKLVRFNKGITGLKAASSSDAGSCIAVSAQKNKMHLICIILGSPDYDTMFSDAKSLLDYSFSVNTYFEPQIEEDALNKIKIKGGEVQEIGVKAENKTGIIIPSGTAKQIKSQIIIPDIIDAPVKSGQIVGEIIFLNDEEKIFKTNIVTCSEVKKKSTFFCFKKLFSYLLKF